MPFTEGLDIHSGGLAKVKRGRYAPLVMWLLGLLVFLVALGEILLRDERRTMSFKYSQIKDHAEFAGLTDGAVREAVVGTTPARSASACTAGWSAPASW